MRPDEGIRRCYTPRPGTCLIRRSSTLGDLRGLLARNLQSSFYNASIHQCHRSKHTKLGLARLDRGSCICREGGCFPSQSCFRNRWRFSNWIWSERTDNFCRLKSINGNGISNRIKDQLPHHLTVDSRARERKCLLRYAGVYLYVVVTWLSANQPEWISVLHDVFVLKHAK